VNLVCLDPRRIQSIHHLIHSISHSLHDAHSEIAQESDFHRGSSLIQIRSSTLSSNAERKKNRKNSMSKNDKTNDRFCVLLPLDITQSLCYPWVIPLHGTDRPSSDLNIPSLPLKHISHIRSYILLQILLHSCHRKNTQLFQIHKFFHLSSSLCR